MGKSTGSEHSKLSHWQRIKLQRLSAWTPKFTASLISIIFIVFSIILISSGVLFYYYSKNIQEIKLDYTNCKNENGTLCADLIQDRNQELQQCFCRVPFEIPEDLEGTVHLYYELTNFYQDHREYANSKDYDQLKGNLGTADSVLAPSPDCSPFDKDSNGKYIFPCGAVANSMFNDSVQLFLLDEGTEREVDLIRTGIAWDSDKEHIYSNPPQLLDLADPIWQHFTKPLDWSREIWELDVDNPDNNGVRNEDFIVWMRISALPDFRKMFRKINSSSVGLNEGLPKGEYFFIIHYDFEVKSFEGTKSLILTEIGFLGGKSSWLGIATLSVGSVTGFLGLLFLMPVLYKKKAGVTRITTNKDYGSRKSTTMRLSKSENLEIQKWLNKNYQ